MMSVFTQNKYRRQQALLYPDVDDSHNAGLQLRDKRRMPRGDTILAILSRQDNLVDRFLAVEGLVRRGKIKSHR
jgi:hypothetical protein